MRYVLHFTQAAQNDLRELEQKIAARILNKLEFFSIQAKPLHFAKKLTDFEYGAYRFRIGDYRVIFDVDARGGIHILMILRVRHRKDAYRI